MEANNAGEALALDKNDAPAGHIAVESEFCLWCGFYSSAKGCKLIKIDAPGCVPSSRADRKSVIFVPAGQSSSPSTLLHPMGSLGEPVEE